MDNMILSAGLGFSESLRSANALMEESPKVFANLLRKSSTGQGVPEGAGSALEYVILCAKKVKADEKTVISSLTRHSIASPALAQTVARTAVSGSDLYDDRGSAPRLLGLDWAITVPTSTSFSPGDLPNAPNVTLQLRLETADGTTVTRALQLNTTQLVQMEASLKEASLSLDRV